MLKYLFLILVLFLTSCSNHFIDNFNFNEKEVGVTYNNFTGQTKLNNITFINITTTNAGAPTYNFVVANNIINYSVTSTLISDTGSNGVYVIKPRFDIYENYTFFISDLNASCTETSGGSEAHIRFDVFNVSNNLVLGTIYDNAVYCAAAQSSSKVFFANSNITFYRNTSTKDFLSVRNQTTILNTSTVNVSSYFPSQVGFGITAYISDGGVCVACLSLARVQISYIQAQDMLVTNIVLNSTDGTNMSSQNLSLSYKSTGYNITDWRINGGSFAHLNMPFEGGSNSTFTNDYSSFGNNGSVVVNVTWSSTLGYGGTGTYNFSGNSGYISIPDATSLKISGNLSLMALINPSRTAKERIIAKGSDGAVNYALEQESTGTVCFQYRTTEALFVQSCSPTVLPLGNWTHVTGVRSGNSTLLYINGLLVNTTINTANATYTDTTPVTLGIQNNLAFPFRGLLDNVQLYNISLSAQQILALYNNRTNLIVSQELKKNDVWSACVTPNDGLIDGVTVCSNNLSVNSPPVVNSANISSKFGLNTTLENITGTWNTTDLDNNPLVNITDWRINGTSIELLNLPFEPDRLNNATDYSTYNLTPLRIINVTFNTTNPATSGMSADFNDKDLNNSFIEYDHNDNFTSVPITIMYWVKPNAISNGNLQDIISDRMVNNIGGFVFETIVNSNQVAHYFYIRNSSIANMVSVSLLYTNQSWQHIAVTYDGQTLRAFKNGGGLAVTSNQATNGTIGKSNATLRIASNSNQSINSKWFNGSIDDLRIYGRNLSRSEINTIYLNSSHVIVNEELQVGDNWTLCVTANDGISNGNTMCSNNITIGNVLNLTSASINSTDLNNATAGNLTSSWISNNALNGKPLINVTDFRINGTSNAFLIALFEGGTTTNYTRDYSANGTNGTFAPFGGPTWNATDGYNGYGDYQFNTTQAIVFNPGATNYDVFANLSVGSKTLLMWLKPKDTLTTRYVAGTMYDNNVGGVGFWNIYIKTNKLQLNYINATNSCGAFCNSFNFVTSNTNVTQGNWTHVAVVMNRTYIAIYLNGIKDTEFNNTDGIKSNGTLRAGYESSGLTIGSETQISVVQFFNGSIDDVLFYDKALSAQQIKSIFNNQTNTLVSQSLTNGDIYSACVTQNDPFQDYQMICSSNLTLNTCGYSGSGNWNFLCGDNCGFNSNIALSGNRQNNITLVGSGNITFNANVTNVLNWNIQGISSTSICKVTCLFGCFK